MQSFCRVLIRRVVVSLVLLAAAGVLGQQPSATLRLRGEVIDPSGARVAHAEVSVVGDGVHLNTHTSNTGDFVLPLQPGDYKLLVEAPGFRRSQVDLTRADLESGRPVEVLLKIATHDEQVEVDKDAALSTASADNGTGLVLNSNDLMSLSDDELTFQREIQAMAGGLSGAPSVFVDGFSGARFPPKSAIAAIRINRDPYAAQYDALGFGRIEIESKAGGDKRHGSIAFSGTQKALNAQDPFGPETQPVYFILNTDGTLSGPLDRKSTFFVSGVYNNQQNNTAVNALLPQAYSIAVPDPQITISTSVRADRQFNPRNLLSGRYELDRITLSNGGVGTLILPSEGYTSTQNSNTLQVSDRQTLNARTVNQLRAEYVRTRLDLHPQHTATGPCTSPQTPSCTVLVTGAFQGGGDPIGVVNNHRDLVEAEDFLSLDRGAHFFGFGGRFRWTRESETSTNGFNGEFVFPSLAAYTANQPTQFGLITGDPTAAASTVDVSIYAEDEWKAARDLTLNFGVRIESQTSMPDHLNWAPRVGVAWSAHRRREKNPFLVVRAGFGIFYDRFAVDQLLTTVHQDGTREQTGYIQDPATLQQIYTAGFTGASLTTAEPTVYKLAPNLHTAYEMIGTTSAEHRFGRFGTLGLTYMWARGDHQYLSLNANAPEPGTGLRPLGGNTNLYQFASGGIEKDQVGFLNWRLNPTRRILVYGRYIAQDLRSSALGATVFPANSYNIGEDFGRKGPSRRQELIMGSTFALPGRFSAVAYLSALSGAPFNITTGTDLNGDTLYTDRPSFATSASPSASVVANRFGRFDLTPQPGERIIPANYGTGPTFFVLSTSLERSFSLGGHMTAAAAGHPAHREGGFDLTVSVEADNVTNHVNGGLPDGVLTSPLFGRSLEQDPTFLTTTAANRIVFLRTSLRF
jgi:hypothetical protein